MSFTSKVLLSTIQILFAVIHVPELLINRCITKLTVLLVLLVAQTLFLSNQYKQKPDYETQISDVYRHYVWLFSYHASHTLT